MLRILSIDYDVFFSLEGILEGPGDCTQKWAVEYCNCPSMLPKDMIFYHKEYMLVKEYLQAANQPVFLGSYHEAIQHYLKDIIGETLQIVNLDRHHDLWLCRGPVTCGSWVSKLAETNDVEVIWHYLEGAHTDLSDADPKIKVSAFEGISTSIFQQPFDLIFLIHSYDYSPAHMQHKFFELVRCCKDGREADNTLDLMPAVYADEIDFLAQQDGVEIYEEGERPPGWEPIAVCRTPFFLKNWTDIEYDPEYFRGFVDNKESLYKIAMPTSEF